MALSSEHSDQRLRLADRRTLAWAEWGDPEGTPVFFFHGGADSRLAAAVIHRAACEAGVRLIAPDRPGYGASDPRPEWRFTDWPEDVFALADRLGIDRFAVMGHSAGSPCTLAMAADPRGRVVAAVVVSGAAPRAATGAGMGVPFRLNRWLAIRAPGLNRRFLASHRRSVFGDAEKFLHQWGRMSPPEGRLFARDPSVAERIVEDMREGYRQGIDAAAHENWLLYQDWGFELSRVEVPVALYYGSADPMCPPAWGEFLEAELPQASLTLVEGEGHFSTLVLAAAEILAKAAGDRGR